MLLEGFLSQVASGLSDLGNLANLLFKLNVPPVRNSRRNRLLVQPAVATFSFLVQLSDLAPNLPKVRLDSL